METNTGYHACMNIAARPPIIVLQRALLHETSTDYYVDFQLTNTL